MKLGVGFSRLLLRGLAVGMVVLAFSVPDQAQWPLHPTAGAPKLPSGKPDMNGPAPKAADGKPDLTGTWGGAGRGGPPGGAPAGRGDRGAPPPAPSPAPQAANGIARGMFQNMGQNMPGGLLPYQPWAKQLREQRLARNSADHPDAHCLPLNPVQLWFHPQPRRLIQAPGEIVFLAEANGGKREIFLDGRPLPDPNVVQPWWFGYSIGHWEGDTLVVESTGFLDNAWVDENGSPISTQARVTERLRRPNYGTLEVAITVDDPKAYTKPWTVSANQRLMADDELIEFICDENNTSVQHLVTK